MPESPFYIFGGRFQPFHIGHLAVLEKIAEDFEGPIVVGIVNPDPRTTMTGDGQDWMRFSIKDNPLNFWERLTSIKLAIKGTELESRVEAIVPLPRPSVNLERANQYIPPRPRFFVLCDKWGDEVEKWKKDSYEKQGEMVVEITGKSLEPYTQIAEASVVRSLIAVGNPKWDRLVPEQEVDYLISIKIRERVAALVDKQKALDELNKFYSNHPLGHFAAELFADEEFSTTFSSGDDSKISSRPARVKSLEHKLAKPFRQDEDETILLLDERERQEISKLCDRLFAEGQLKTMPQYLPTGANMIQTTLTNETYLILKKQMNDFSTKLKR